MHRKITGKIKTVTISRSICGHFHACILAENGAPLPPISTSGNAIGIDLGVIDLAVTSNGSKYKNPKHLQRAETNLARKQRKFSRKKRGSKGRDKARQLVARVYERIACARKDYLHKLSRRIVNENQVIAVESLYVKGMTRNHKLAKSISDAGWSTLVKFLEYKAAEGGKAFIKCDRWYPSSKTCSNCGAVYTNLLLSVRTWECRNCGICHDRDINAARNICNEGLRIILAGGAPATASRGNVSRVVG